MRYAISDIHGEAELLSRLLKKIDFSEKDTLFVLGDMIDKGEESVRVLEMLLPMKNVKIIMGNHERAFLDYYRSVMRECGEDSEAALEKIREYFPRGGDRLSWEHIDALEDLPLYFDEEDFIGVHAGVSLDEEGRVLPPSEIKESVLLYDRRLKEPDFLPADSRCILFGHTPTDAILSVKGIAVYRRKGASGGVLSDYIKIHLDTGAFTSGILGVFCLDTCLAYYVNK